MTDREMLELAAKAFWGDEIDDECSIRWLEVDQAIGYTHGENQDHNGNDCERVWNPLADDGDALRLAVKLGLINHRTELVTQLWAARRAADPMAATRRAIVRAAAEIGRAMP